MAKVSDLKIAPQSGSDSTVYATWKFNETTSSSSASSSTARKGDTVTIKPGSRWYNGASIPSFVMNRPWIVYQVSGVRAVLNQSPGTSYAIMSPIHVNNLVKSGSSSSSGGTIKANTLDHYEVEWWYMVDGVWFTASSSTTKYPSATYNYPSNATKVEIDVTPVSKTYQSNGKDTSYWTGTKVSKVYLISESPPSRPSAPTVEIEKYNLTASLVNIEDAKADQIEFEVVQNADKFASGIVTVVTARAIYSCAISPGEKYRVRCRAINLVGTTKVYSEWSQYSSELLAVPSTPDNVKCSVESKTSMVVSWDEVLTADTYTVEYTTNKMYFDSSSEVKSITVEAPYAYITGMETGHEYYFRVKATNDKGESGWSEIVYKVIGTKPEAPTTWSLTSTAIIGDDVTLYWVHNSEDGSVQNEAQIELTMNGEATVVTIDTSEEDKEEAQDKIYSYPLDLTNYAEGVEILWRVRTRGITFEYSDWSIQRTINTYAPPTLMLQLSDGSGYLNHFPFDISATAGPNTQTAISYHVSVTAEYAHEVKNDIGETELVNEGQEIYSKVFNLSDNNFSLELLPEDMNLENYQTYTVTVTVSMNSGLVATASDMFTVGWADDTYEPDAAIAIDKETLCTYISPFCIDLDDNLVEDVVLAVYRREFDGSFTEIASNLVNNGAITVTDPHPSLDYARYRIVARNVNTRVIGYEDLPGQPINEPSIVIQWDEKWSQFDYSEESEASIPPWSGSMIRLPGNVDVSENYAPDVSLVEYIGRKHPVSYYGTQRGSSGNWSCEIPADDKETLYALRRLAAWPGDVYVREPSGNGYPAQITVGMSMKHLGTTIPVSFDVKRVDGEK